jgi:hypothetical protein
VLYWKIEGAIVVFDSRLLKYIYQANGIPSRIAYGSFYNDKKFDQIYSEWEAQFRTAHIPKTFFKTSMVG